ncbi:22082_t:CDS:2, partial [Racocetra persica]
ETDDYQESDSGLENNSKYLLLKATISNGWSFRWVENKDSKEIFTYLNPTLNLPTRKYLSRKILTNASLDIIYLIEKKAQLDTIEVLVWKVQNVSTERSRTTEIIKKIETLTKSYKKVLSMAQIKGVLNQARRNQEIEMIKNMYYSSSAKISIEPEESNEPEELNEPEESNESGNSDLEDFESEDMTSGDNWDNIMSILNQMLNYESEANIEENDDLQDDDNISNNSASFSVNRIHPQKDPNAKWDLDTLFCM